MFQIYFMNSVGGGFVYGEDGDYGSAIHPDNARTFTNKKDCRLVIQDCATRWHVPSERFVVFKRA